LSPQAAESVVRTCPMSQLARRRRYGWFIWDGQTDGRTDYGRTEWRTEA